MKNSKQLLLAFFIPFSLALVLTGAGLFIYPDLIYNYTGIDIHKIYIGTKPDTKGEGLKFSGEYSSTLEESIYGLSIVSLIILAELLPFLICLRGRQTKKAELKLIKS